MKLSSLSRFFKLRLTGTGKSTRRRVANNRRIFRSANTFAFLFSCLLYFFSTPLSAQVAFAPPVRYTIPSPDGGLTTSQGLAVADLNGDGRPDVAVAVVNGVVVMMNTGGSTLASPITYSVPGSNAAIVAADFNGDGHPDLAVLSSHLSVLINKGDGTFTVSPTTYSFDLIPTGTLVAGDLDHDGKIDLALITVFDFGQIPTLIRLKNDGTAIFTKLPGIALSGGARYLGLADLNKDGYPDLITGNNNCINCIPTISVLLNGKNGSFVTTDYTSNSFITTGDLNGDGAPEIVGNPGSNNPQIFVMLNNGAGVFHPQILYPAGAVQATNSVVVADFDGDGFSDLATFFAGHLTTIRNLGNAIFGPPTDYQLSDVQFSTGIATADMDGDGQPDIVAVGSQQNPNATFLYVFKNKSALPTLPFIIGNPRGGNLGSVSFSIFYSALASGTTVKLVGQDASAISGTNLSVSPANSHLLLATFDLRGAAPGLYDLVLTNVDGTNVKIPGAFTVEVGTTPTVVVSLVGRNVMRGGQSQMYFVDVTNEGNVDAGLARVWIAAPDYIKFSATTQAPSSSGILGGTSYVAFDVQKVNAGSTVSIGVFIAVPDDPKYGHQKFQIQAWKESR